MSAEDGDAAEKAAPRRLDEYRSRRGSRFIRTDCVTCGAECNPDTGEHNQRAWARTHVINNPDHQVHVETTSTRIYINAQPRVIPPAGGAS